LGENLVESLPENLGENLVENLPENLPERLGENRGESLAEHLGEILPENPAENLAERLAERLPEKLGERLPERLVEHLPSAGVNLAEHVLIVGHSVSWAISRLGREFMTLHNQPWRARRTRRPTDTFLKQLTDIVIARLGELARSMPLDPRPKR
jgi:hypothetical protein